ncbi:hypothetical protein FSO04_31520 [Paraburkholderia madseniana]|uniref:Uncharacterized protein n=1 Tax=Paraburkholderia madseniana TaxID=2599607 RepID=A0A6N6W8W0_9BURK|nr:hypothetical protein [Paraburkholderia madseniana]KAE8755990.1 hypothetical protein FSO04_31520 [Paraburkholderia madseniana]
MDTNNFTHPYVNIKALSEQINTAVHQLEPYLEAGMRAIQLCEHPASPV